MEDGTGYENPIPAKSRGIDEFPGYEIETKLQVVDAFSWKLVEELKDVITYSRKYQLSSGLEDLSWDFQFDYYGYIQDNEPMLAFVLVHNPAASNFYLRRKTGLVYSREGIEGECPPVLRRSEHELVIDKPFASEARQEAIQAAERLIGEKVVHFGTVERTKHYFFVEILQAFRGK